VLVHPSGFPEPAGQLTQALSLSLSARLSSGAALIGRLLAESLVPCGLFSREVGTLLDPEADGALNLCVFEGDQETERELRDDGPFHPTGKRLPYLHLAQTGVARFEIGDERAESPPALRLVRDRLTGSVVVEDAVQVDEIAWLIAIAHRM
jgi:hypothetical protein